MTDLLSELAEKYGTDKGLSAHSYTPLYDALLGKKRFEVRKVFEIGVLRGASLRMWREYFPNARVLGVDVSAPVSLSEPRIEAIQGDAGNPETVQMVRRLLGRDIDLVVDDGSHAIQDVAAAFASYFPLVKKGGLYVVEDLDPGHVGHGLWVMPKL